MDANSRAETNSILILYAIILVHRLLRTTSANGTRACDIAAGFGFQNTKERWLTMGSRRPAPTHESPDSETLIYTNIQKELQGSAGNLP